MLHKTSGKIPDQARQASFDGKDFLKTIYVTGKRSGPVKPCLGGLLAGTVAPIPNLTRAGFVGYSSFQGPYLSGKSAIDRRLDSLTRGALPIQRIKCNVSFGWNVAFACTCYVGLSSATFHSDETLHFIRWMGNTPLLTILLLKCRSRKTWSAFLDKQFNNHIYRNV